MKNCDDFSTFLRAFANIADGNKNKNKIGHYIFSGKITQLNETLGELQGYSFTKHK